MEGFPSGQREQTVNLSSMTSVVRIHHLPPKRKDIPKGMSFLLWRKAGGGFESRLLETCRWHVSTGVALPQQSESTTGRAGTRPIRRKERSFNDEIYQRGPFVTIYCHLRCYPAGAQNHTVRGRTLRLAKSRLRRLLAGRPLRWVCSPLRFSRCR